MELPDLHELNQVFYNTQIYEPVITVYACFTCDSFRGGGGFCFYDDLEVWKDLYPAVLFIEALIDQTYDIYEPEDLTKLISIYIKYIDSTWSEADFDSFWNDFSSCVLSYDIEFLGKTSQLLEIDTQDSFIERIHKSFRGNPKENEEEFMEFLGGYST